VGGKRTDAAARPVGIFGPEPWRTVAGVEWSYWDLWFCVVCVLDHHGSWDALDAAIRNADRHYGEAKWSHLLDLTERLRQAGLDAAELAGASANDRTIRTKARTKVLKSSLYERDLTPAMRNPPSAQLGRRALFGSWPRFPRSPQRWYDTLTARFDIEDYPYWNGWVTNDLAHDIAEAVQELARRAGDDAAEPLAVRRAALTLYYQAAQICDDSYGGLGDVAGEAVTAYARTAWRASSRLSRYQVASVNTCRSMPRPMM
jgi:hypothetical protein